MKVFIAILVLISFTFPLVAQEPEKYLELKKKVIEIVETGYDFVTENSSDMGKINVAFQNNPEFNDNANELYIFMHTYNAEKKEVICCGHGVRFDLIGKNMWSLRTPTGRLLFHEFIELLENNNEGWVDYDWLNPFTNQLETKHSFIKKIILNDGQTAWIGCGYWLK